MNLATVPFRVAAFVLAGGQSSRMGSDKALALFAGVPLIQNALNLLSAACPYSEIAPSIAGSRSDLSAYAYSIPDTYSNVGPLGGIHAALEMSAAEWNLFLPVDMPLMPASLLRLLIERVRVTNAPVTACKLAGRLEPYPVLLHCSVMPYLTVRIQNGQSAGHQAWREIPTELDSLLDAPSVENLIQTGQIEVAQHGLDPAETKRLHLPPAFWFKSCNTPDELAFLNGLQKSA